MNTIRNLSLCVLLAVGLVHAQTAPTFTTLASAMGVNDQTVNLTSSTGVSASASLNAPVTGIFVDREYLTITTNVNPAGTGNVWNVRRVQSGVASLRGGHASGAAVWIGPPGMFDQGPNNKSGSCTRGNQLYLPVINVRNGVVSDCLGGSWVSGSGTSARWRVYAPEPGGTAYTSLNTNGTAVGATTLYCTEVNLPSNKLLTGIGVLNGTTVTANARYVVLYDSGGTALANSALAGQASVTASVYETYAFTSKFFAVGPAQYFGCIQDNSTGSTTVRMAVTGVNDNILTKGQTSATFGTVGALTAPTGFVTSVGPYIFIY